MGTTLDDEQIDRVASLAVGPAFSHGHDDQDAIDELIDSADRDPDVLRAARTRVAGLPVGDARTHQQAVQLLDQAARRCERAQGP